VLEEMLKAVDEGKTEIVRKQKGVIVNKAV